MRRVCMRIVEGMLCLAAVVLVGLPAGMARAQGVDTNVFYHDQSGTVLNAATVPQATGLASRRLGFTVRLPASWPQGSPLRAVWVMERQAPRFVVFYYGAGYGMITCQLHESLDATSAALHWAPVKSVTIGTAQGQLLQSYIGGAYPVSELIWRAHGIRFDLLGSAAMPLATLLTMAASL